MQLYQRTKTAKIHFAIAEPFLSRKTQLQDDAWAFYLRQTSRNPASDRNHVNVSAVGWEGSSRVKIVINSFGSNDDNSVPSPWKCSYDVERKVFVLAAVAAPSPEKTQPKLDGINGVVDEDAPLPSGSDAKSGEALQTLVANFVINRHSLEQKRQLDSIMQLYGDKVRYYDYGEVDRAFIESDKRKYFLRWPKASSRLVGHIHVVGDGPLWKVSFREDFGVENPSAGKSVTGSVEVNYEVVKHDGRLQIVGEQSKVLSRKTK